MRTQAESVAPGIWADRARNQLWIRTPYGMTMVEGREISFYSAGRWSVEVQLLHPEIASGTVTGEWSLSDGNNDR